MNQEQFNADNASLKTTRIDLINLLEANRICEVDELQPVIKAIQIWDSQEQLEIATVFIIDDDMMKVKMLYPNERTRSAELLCRQTASKERKELVDKQAQLQSVIAKSRFEIESLRIDCAFLENQINWGIGHVSDEINDLLISVYDKIDILIDKAAENAIRKLIKRIDSVT